MAIDNIDARSGSAQALLITYDQLLSRLPNDFTAPEMLRIADSRLRLARVVLEKANLDFDELDIP